MAEPATRTPDPYRGDPLPEELALAFAPLRKFNFGVAIGVVCGGLVLAVTLFHVILKPDHAPNLGLLSQYFAGYSVSWHGALIGMGWGFGVGFITGWFVAFCRNFTIATSIFITRTRAELAATRDFLDHI